MKVLAIGNSFSQDAMRYLHNIAASDNAELKAVNLYIGGCSLYTHYINALEDRKNYMFEFNGQSTGLTVSIKEALISDQWDVVTMQQVSHQSPYYDSYMPYLSYLRSYIEKYSPKSKVYIHQTWAYESGSNRLCNELGYSEPSAMLDDIRRAYNAAAKDIRADGIIPSGELFDELIKSGIPKIHRDTYHASFGTGRYALGMLWYACLTGHDIGENSFCAADEPVDGEEKKIVKQAVTRILKRYEYI